MTHRHKRVEVAIYRVISGALQESEISPETWKISVTRVFVTPDLHFARIFFSHLDGETARVDAERFFRENLGRLRRVLAAHLRLRRQPTISFTWDGDFLEAEKVDRIIAEIAEEGGPAPGENREPGDDPGAEKG